MQAQATLFDAPGKSAFRKVVPRVRLRLVRESDYTIRVPRITSPQDAVDAFRQAVSVYHADDMKETLHVAHLSTKNDVLAIEPVATGSSNAAHIDPKEIFRGALVNGAVSIILAHNHPSGDPTPSPQDIQLTRLLLDGARLLDIEILDHVILGENGRYVSLKERGVM